MEAPFDGLLVRVMGDVQMSNRLKSEIGRCGIQNPGRFCLQNRKSRTLELFFSVFYLFIHFFFLIFGTETNTLNAILSSCFDNTFKYFQLAQPVRDPQFKVRSPMVCLYGCNQRRTCSGLPNKRGGTWLPLCFLTSSRIIKGKSGFRLLGSIRLFNIGG